MTQILATTTTRLTLHQRLMDQHAIENRRKAA